MLRFPSGEFDEAVAGVCHGTADEAEMRALNELLRKDAEARDEYLVRVELHARLASDPDLFAQTHSCISADRAAAASPTTAETNPDQGLVPFTPAKRLSLPIPMVLALAACLVLSLIGVWNFGFKRRVSRSGATSTAIAMLTQAVDARWAAGVVAPRVGAALEPGWFRLETGMAQIVFYSGARVVVEGPAELRLVSPGEVICARGRLIAEVPPPAHGFRIRTDQLVVVDLGTAFGVEATQARTEVHVFKGTVELSQGNAAKQPLRDGQAAVANQGDAPKLMSASKATFSSLFEFQQRCLASQAFRSEQWQFENAKLNQDPSLLVHFDFEDPDEFTLRNGAENFLSHSDATIVGCQRGEGRWREKHALEFQSVNDRARLTVPGAFQAMTLSAWVCVKGLDRQFNSLFMCDGFKPGTLHWLIRNDGVLGLTVIGSGEGNFQIIASSPVLRLDSLGQWMHLAAVVDGSNKRVVHYVNGVAVTEHALRIRPPFRIDAAELGNWNASGFPGNDPSLIRNFSGAMDEFCLFSRALSAEEIRALYSAGKPQVDSVAELKTR